MKHGRSAIKIDSSTPARSSLVATIAFSPILVAISGPTKGVDARSQHANVFFAAAARFFPALLSSFSVVLRLFSQGNGNFLSMHVLWGIQRT